MNTAQLLSDIDPPNLLNFGETLSKIGKSQRAKFRIFLFMRQTMRCHYCRCKMTLDFPTTVERGKQSDTQATFEHLVDDWARPEGKDNSLDKIVLACFKCNNDRNTERQKRALGYYKAKFGGRSDWRSFACRAKPSDYLTKYGHWEQFTDSGNLNTIEHPQGEV